MAMTMVFLAFSWIGVAGTNQASPTVELKPVAITLEAPPMMDTPRSCVLRFRGSDTNILSVAASDPAITVDLRENPAGRLYVVTATLPAGYPVTAGREPVYLLVRTDQPQEPLIRIPVRVWPERKPDHDIWLKQAKQLIGRPLPTVTLDRLGGGTMEIRAQDWEVTVVVFSAHWCGHCDQHVPIIESIWKDYAGRHVQFLGIAGGIGNGQGIVDAADRWEVDWPIGVDRGLRVVQLFGLQGVPRGQAV